MFFPVKHDTGAAQPFEYLAAKAGTYKAGQLLSVSDGLLTAIDAAVKTTPPYLCVAQVTIENDGDPLPVNRVSDDIIYETTLSAAAEGVVVGAKLEISAGGLAADNAAAGTFEVTQIDGTAVGDAVRGRFV